MTQAVTVLFVQWLLCLPVDRLRPYADNPLAGTCATSGSVSFKEKFALPEDPDNNQSLRSGGTRYPSQSLACASCHAPL